MKSREHQKKGKTPPGIVMGSVLSAVSFAALTAFGAQAQDRGGLLANLDLSFGGNYTANDPDDDEYNVGMWVGFGLESVTESQSFAVDADFGLVFDEEEAGLGVDNPAFSLDYAVGNRSTLLDAGLSYSIRDVDGELELIDPVTGRVRDLIDDDGTLEALDIDIGLVTGRDAKFGNETRFLYTDRTYSDTSDPDLNDVEGWQISTAFRFDVDPRISLRADASYRETVEEDFFESLDTIARATVGGTFLIDPLWSAGLNLGYSRFETQASRFRGSPTLSENEGVVYDIFVSRRFRDGSFGVSFSQEITDIGSEETLRFSRSRALANGGELAWSIGAITLPEGETRPIASALYVVPTARGSFRAQLDQTATETDDDESAISSSLVLDYDQAINTRSDWSLIGSVSRVDVTGSTDDDQARVEVGLAYSYALTRDWDLRTSLRHRVTYEGGDIDNRANILSLSLERSFSFRP